MTGAPILVTGGAGFIGSHVCKLLFEAGYLPVTLDNLSTGHEDAVQFGPLERSDTRDSACVGEILGRWRPQAIIHMADMSNVAESVADPAKYYDNNVRGSIALFEAAVALGNCRIIYSSSASVYAPAEPARPLKEDAAIGPGNPYGETKAQVEKALGDYCRTRGFSALAFRFFNAAGSDPGGLLGERHEPETHLIPLLLEVAAGRREQIIIHGRDFETEDGTAIRDYVHVEDIARAHILGLGFLADANRGHFGIFNLGNDQGHSVRQVIEAARGVTGRPIPSMFGQRRAGDPSALVADSGLARAEIGWQPTYPRLEDQIAHAWAWSSKRPLLRMPFRDRDQRP